MASNLAIADLVTARDNLLVAYTTISTSATNEYTLGDRTFRYEDRNKIWMEIKELNKIILLRDPVFNARGVNRADFRSWG